jgi:6-phosphogluconolactonase (cycloisomerase 2 family)
MLHSSCRFAVVCLPVLLILTLFIAGCGGVSTTPGTPPPNPAPGSNPGGNGGGTNPSATEIAIVGNHSSIDARGPGHLTGFRVDSSTGALVQSFDVPFTSPVGVAVSPSNAILAVENFQGVTTFTIAPGTGTLTQVAHAGDSGASFAETHSVLFHPSGKFLYALTGKVAGLAVDASGNLTPIAGSPFGSDGFCAELDMDPTGNYVFALCRHGNFEYKIDQNTGALTNEKLIDFVTPTFNSTGRMFFTVHFLASGANLETWSFDTNTGEMGRISAIPVSPRQVVPSLVITRDDGFLYLTFGSGILGFSVSPSGTLTPLNGGNSLTGDTAGILNVDLTNRFLYAGSGNGKVLEFVIDHSTGNLTPAGSIAIPDEFRNMGFALR